MVQGGWMLGVGVGGMWPEMGVKSSPSQQEEGPTNVLQGAGLFRRPPQSSSLGALLCPELLVPTHAWGGYQLPS